jgi:hypothetical protein
VRLSIEESRMKFANAINIDRKSGDVGHPSIGGQDSGLGIALLNCGSNTCMSNLPGKTRPWRILAVLVQGCIAHLRV